MNRATKPMLHPEYGGVSLVATVTLAAASVIGMTYMYRSAVFGSSAARVEQTKGDQLVGTLSAATIASALLHTKNGTLSTPVLPLAIVNSAITYNTKYFPNIFIDNYFSQTPNLQETFQPSNFLSNTPHPLWGINGSGQLVAESRFIDRIADRPGLDNFYLNGTLASAAPAGKLMPGSLFATNSVASITGVRHDDSVNTDRVTSVDIALTTVRQATNGGAASAVPVSMNLTVDSPPLPIGVGAQVFDYKGNLVPAGTPLANSMPFYLRGNANGIVGTAVINGDFDSQQISCSSEQSWKANGCGGAFATSYNNISAGGSCVWQCAFNNLNSYVDTATPYDPSPMRYLNAHLAVYSPDRGPAGDDGKGTQVDIKVPLVRLPSCYIAALVGDNSTPTNWTYHGEQTVSVLAGTPVILAKVTFGYTYLNNQLTTSGGQVFTTNFPIANGVKETPASGAPYWIVPPEGIWYDNPLITSVVIPADGNSEVTEELFSSSSGHTVAALNLDTTNPGDYGVSGVVQNSSGIKACSPFHVSNGGNASGGNDWVDVHVGAIPATCTLTPSPATVTIGDPINLNLTVAGGSSPSYTAAVSFFGGTPQFKPTWTGTIVPNDVLSNAPLFATVYDDTGAVVATCGSLPVNVNPCVDPALAWPSNTRVGINFEDLYYIDGIQTNKKSPKYNATRKARDYNDTVMCFSASAGTFVLNGTPKVADFYAGGPRLVNNWTTVMSAIEQWTYVTVTQLTACKSDVMNVTVTKRDGSLSQPTFGVNNLPNNFPGPAGGFWLHFPACSTLTATLTLDPKCDVQTDHLTGLDYASNYGPALGVITNQNCDTTGN